MEVQLNHEKVLLAKKGAHKFYETVRETLPRLCQDGGGAVDADELEAFIVGQLNSSALDAAVKVLVDKAGGLMLYARLLEQSLEETNSHDKVDFGALTALPAGLDEMYTTNFGRTFPEGRRWCGVGARGGEAGSRVEGQWYSSLSCEMAWDAPRGGMAFARAPHRGRGRRRGAVGGQQSVRVSAWQAGEQFVYCVHYYWR